MADHPSQWHWAEGMRYATEGIKLLFLLNGASALAILTFMGNTKSQSASLAFAMVYFAFGAVTAVATMILAYLAQLFYGNAELQSVWSDPYKAQRLRASICHIGAYLTIILGVFLFLDGIDHAARSFLSGQLI